MKISKSAWHYRLLNSFCTSVPNRLCPYFWKLIGCIFVILLGVTAVTVLGNSVFLIVAKSFGWVLTWPVMIGGTIAGIVGLGAILTASVAIVAGAVVGIGYLKAKAQDKLYEASSSNEKVRVFQEYGKAVHSKICPFIEFEAKQKPKPKQS